MKTYNVTLTELELNEILDYTYTVKDNHLDELRYKLMSVKLDGTLENEELNNDYKL